MKKLLLLPACALGIFAMNAQDFSEYFTVEYNGKAVENGGKIVVTDYEKDNEQYSARVYVKNVQDTPRFIFGSMTTTAEGPSKAAMLDESAPDFDETLGSPSFCFGGSMDGIPFGNCLSPTENSSNLGSGIANPAVPVAGTGNFYWDIHQILCTSESAFTYRVTMVPMEGETFGDLEEADVDPFVFTLVFDKNAAGVEAVEFDENLPVEYFDLQGRHVANPAAGIYVARQGNKVAKRVIR